MKRLRDEGFMVAKVEQKLAIPGKHIKIDCYGIGDLLIAKPGWGVALVQVTSMGHVEEHHDKCLSAMHGPKNQRLPALETWLAAGGKFLIHGWSKRGPRGKRKTWHVVESVYNLKGQEKGKGE